MKKFFELLIILITISFVIFGGIFLLSLLFSIKFIDILTYIAIFIGIIIVAIILYALVDLISYLLSLIVNRKYPIETVQAKIVNKTVRKITKNSDDYYITFELESKVRIELEVSSNNYGIFLEGDKGKLIYQGTRFISFERVTD